MTFNALKVVYLLRVSGIVGWMGEIKTKPQSDCSGRKMCTGYFESTGEQREGHMKLPGVRDA